MTDVEKTVTYSTSVESLEEAWVFLMALVDEFSAPTIVITPMYSYSVEDQEYSILNFSVTVSGEVEP